MCQEVMQGICLCKKFGYRVPNCVLRKDRNHFLPFINLGTSISNPEVFL